MDPSDCAISQSRTIHHRLRTYYRILGIIYCWIEIVTHYLFGTIFIPMDFTVDMMGFEISLFKIRRELYRPGASIRSWWGVWGGGIHFAVEAWSVNNCVHWRNRAKRALTLSMTVMKCRNDKMCAKRNSQLLCIIYQMRTKHTNICHFASSKNMTPVIDAHGDYEFCWTEGTFI